MGKKENIIAIIPARGGSKSIPRKNIKLLDGYPLISYSIAAALQSRSIDRVIVSTDDHEIADIALRWGAEVPFFRPTELADDNVLDFPVFVHCIEWLESNENYRPDIIVQLRPTSPFRPKNCLDEAIRLLENDKNADSVRGITESGQNPFKMWKISGKTLEPLLRTEYKEAYNMPRQELPSTYWQTGHIEVIRYHTIMGKQSMTGDTILPYIIDTKFAIDLDNIQQWEFAEFMMEQFDHEVCHPYDLFQYLESSSPFVSPVTV
jgi:N-acylneuraminate cytidylyltransferase